MLIRLIATLWGIWVCLSVSSQANFNVITEKQAIEMALKNNPQMTVAAKRIEKQQKLKQSAYSIENMEVVLEAPTGEDLRPGVMQRFSFPTAYGAQSNYLKSNIKLAESEKEVTTNNLIFSVRTTINHLNYLSEKYEALRKQDSIFTDIVNINDVRYKVGQISNLEKINGEAFYKQIQFNMLQTRAALQNERIQLSILVGRPEDTTIITDGVLRKIIDYEVDQLPDTSFTTNPLTKFYKQQIVTSRKSLALERNKALPGLVLGYLDQGQPNSKLEYRVRFGVTLPLWFWTYSSRISAAKKDVEISQEQSKLNNYQLKGEYSKELAQLRQYSTAVKYFETVGIAQSNEIIKSAKESYRSGSIGYYFYLQNLVQAFQIQLNALEALKDYNLSIITLQYLLGDQKY